MADAILSQARLKELLHYDPATGIFTRRVATSNNVRVGDIAGCTHASGYVSIRVDGKKYLAHRLAWLYVHGLFPDYMIDHRNHVRSDNRLANLREATQTQNQQNRNTPRSDNRTGYIGVTFHKHDKNYVAVIQADGKYKRIGAFPTAELAHAAYMEEKAKLHELFAG